MKKFLIFILFGIIPFSIKSQQLDTFPLKDLGEIKIQASGKKESTIQLVNTIKNNHVISDGVSVEFIKKTPDRNVGDALRRVNGVTIQNDKFILVRGLSDRYNVVYLNKNVLPTTEPDRRTFSFDVIPTNLVDNIIVIKSPAANLAGDFGGGIVQITTKEVSNKFFNIGLGAGWGSLSSLNTIKLVDYQAFPTNFPSTYTFRTASLYQRIVWTSNIKSPTETDRNSLINPNMVLSFGTKRNNLSLLLNSTIRNTYNIGYFNRLDFQSPTELSFQYKDTLFSQNFLANGLLNLTYLKGDIKYSFKTLFNHQVENSYLLRVGENYDNVQDVKSNSSNTITKTIINSQFDGKIKSLNFNLGYNLMLREQPDYRINPLQKSLGVNENYTTAWRDSYRFWSILNETSLSGNVSGTIKDFKLGGGYVNKFRTFTARIFRYDSKELLNEITNNTDKYNADFKLANGFLMWDKKYNKLSINAGIRNEYNTFDVYTSDFSGQKIQVNRNYFDLLPSVNLAYDLKDTKIRLSVSKTLARPEFREIANFAYYDFVRNAQIIGNPKLEKTDIYNVDIKFEKYPKAGENISFCIFGKRFINPIEQIVDNGSVPSNLILTFSNPANAYVYGVEFELRERITNWLDFYTNTSLINSEVVVNGMKRQLQGQSNYILNGGINLHKGNNTLNLTYNRIGERISLVGFQGYGDIYENSRDIVDIVFLRKIKKTEIKLAISDILAQPTKFYQKDRDKDLITQRNETTISLSLNINL